MEEYPILKLTPEEHLLKIDRTAHYYTLGHDINEASYIWILIHGYGQLASRMIRKFDHVDLTKHYFMAPEAISKHYVKRTPNIVGATWMTKEHRLDEIDDYLSYLNQLIDPIFANLSESQTINILGFSQGTSTMWRWIAARKPPLSCIINWAGEFPPELDYNNMSPYLKAIPHKYFCVGNNDEYLSQEHKDKLQFFVKENSMDFKFKFFEGTHVVDQETFGEILREIE